MTVKIRTDDFNDNIPDFPNQTDLSLQGLVIGPDSASLIRVVGPQLAAVSDSSTTTTGGVATDLTVSMPANLSTSRNVITTLLGTLTGDVNTISTHVNNLDTQVNLTDTRVNAIAGKINSLATDVAAVSDKLNALLGRLRTHGLISS